MGRVRARGRDQGRGSGSGCWRGSRRRIKMRVRMRAWRRVVARGRRERQTGAGILREWSGREWRGER